MQTIAKRIDILYFTFHSECSTPVSLARVTHCFTCVQPGVSITKVYKYRKASKLNTIRAGIMFWAAYGSLGIVLCPNHRAKSNVQASATIGSLLRGQLYLIVITIYIIFINLSQIVLWEISSKLLHFENRLIAVHSTLRNPIEFKTSDVHRELNSAYSGHRKPVQTPGRVTNSNPISGKMKANSDRYRKWNEMWRAFESMSCGRYSLWMDNIDFISWCHLTFVPVYTHLGRDGYIVLSHDMINTPWK